MRPQVGDIFEYIPHEPHHEGRESSEIHYHTYLAVITDIHPRRCSSPLETLASWFGFPPQNYSANIYALQQGEDGFLHFDPTDRRWNGLLDFPFSRGLFKTVNARRIDISPILKGEKPIKTPEPEKQEN